MIKRISHERRRTERSEARYFVRYSLFYPEQRRLGIEEFEATTADLSERGVALIADQNIDTGAHLIIRFSVNNEMGNTLSSHRKIVVFTGTLVYSESAGENRYRLGVAFHPGQNQPNEDKFVEIICSPSYCWPIGGWEEDVPNQTGLSHN